MSLVASHRTPSRPLPLTDGGTQYVDGVLTINAPMTIVLSAAVFTSGGYYTLFDYSGGSFVGNISNITVDSSALVNATFNSVIHDTANKKIYLSLTSVGNIGTQYVEGTLSISGPTTVYLDSTLFGSEGIYTLFDWSGGGSFSGTASNLTVVPLKTTLAGTTPYVDGSTLKVRLVRS